MPIAHILSQGNEITTGQLVDTNAATLARTLHELGFRVRGSTSCGDVLEDIVAAVITASTGADLVISTGGLGPTEDDLTARAVAAALDAPLVTNDEALALVRATFARMDRPMADANRKQAVLPRGARVIPNPRGTAPGFTVERGATLLVFLPGVPGEMRQMLRESVVPLVEARWALSPPLVATFRVAGVGESDLQERLAPLADLDPRIHLGFRTWMIENHVKLLVTGDTADPETRALFDEARRRVSALLGRDCYATDDRTLPEVVNDLLRRRGETVTAAESCTGGLLAGAITGVPGSSDVFARSYVTYADEAKRQVLGVPRGLLREHGAVSGPVAEAMARGARDAAGADWALALTGIAGPTGGTEDKPVGLVYVAAAGPERTRVRRLRFFRDRDLNRNLSVYAALEMLRREIERASA